MAPRVVATEAVRGGAPVLYADYEAGTVRLAAGPEDDGATAEVDAGALTADDPDLEWIVPRLKNGFWGERDAPGAPFARHHHHHDHGRDPDDLAAHIEAQIAEHGWFCQQVLITEADRAEDPDAFDFSYTVGLRDTFGHPDLIVSGMTPDSAYNTLLTVIDRLREGRRFSAGDVDHGGVLQGGDVLFVAVSEEAKRKHMTITHGFYGEEPFEALQVVFPDREGRWPWEEGSRAAAQELFGARPGPATPPASSGSRATRWLRALGRRP